MSLTVLRTAESWWVERDGRAAEVATPATTTAELMADRNALDEALERAVDGVVTSRLVLISPITKCRIIAQLANYRVHAKESGLDPDRLPPTFFRKSSASLSGPFDPVIKPEFVTLLDYEIELGLVMGAPLNIGDTVTTSNLPDFVAGLVIANDVSARDVQLTKGQFYEAKSYPTFTPVGPRLVLLDRDDFVYLDDLRLQLSVNKVVRQDSTLADMIVGPAKALSLIARFQELAPGDLLLTGTPGGCALKAPPKIVEKVGALLPPHLKWKIFLKRQAQNPAYLAEGDELSLSIRSSDGAIDLGTQVTAVRYARA